MPTQNSPIAVSGIGKDSVRTDRIGSKSATGTPGLQGTGMKFGDVQELEAGQRAVQNTKAVAPQGGGGPLPGAAQVGPVQAPDPLAFAAQKIGGGNPAVPTGDVNRVDGAKWIPLLGSMAASKGASSLLRRQYTKMLSRAMTEPWSSGTAVIDGRKAEQDVNDAFTG